MLLKLLCGWEKLIKNKSEDILKETTASFAYLKMRNVCGSN